MKRLSIVLTCAAAAAVVSADYVTPDEALARLGGESRAVVSATLIQERPEIYVFSTEEGYMILPSDDIARPLLAYGADFGDGTNTELDYWLNFYAGEIAAAREGVANCVHSPQKVRAEIAPMVKAKWSQGDPYNMQCPMHNGKRSVTGCVATAMAQVMYYYKWPEKGLGVHSYEWENGGQTLSFNYNSTTFNWEDMTNVYDRLSISPEKKAVAELMYAAGVSVDMNYGSTESGAVSFYMMRAFIENFRYDKAVWWAQRDYYSDTDWEDMIYGELAAGRPVLYGGAGSGGAHQFVVDGYSSADDLYHINWGWGGTSDGYFALSALNPGELGTGGGTGGFNSTQHALIGLQKPVSGSVSPTVFLNSEAFLPESNTATLGSDLTFSGFFTNFGYKAGKFALGVRFTPEAPGREPVNVGWTTTNECPPLSGWKAFSVKIPMSLRDGKYTVTPVYHTDADTEWRPIPTNRSVCGSLTALVDDIDVTFTPDPSAADGIEEIQSSLTPDNSTLYDLQGRRVVNPGHGLYIRAGKKVLL